MLRYLLIITLLLLTYSCGGGGKHSHGPSQSSAQVDTSKKFKIGGAVKGLSGNLAIANGDDTVTIGTDGKFIFAKSVSEGALYSVKIVALPPNQLCELRNSKNYAYRDHYDIAIECASLVERNIRMSLPANIKLDEVRLLSNYQAKGGQGEEQLSDLVTKMMVFDNSVVSLRNADNKILLLAYLGDITAEEFELSSKSTAIALMLLEPTVISALQDRGFIIGDVADQLVTEVNAGGDIDLLATEIQNLIINNGNLNSPHSTLPTGTFASALGRVLDSAVRVIANGSALPPKQKNAVAANSTVVHQKLSDGNSSDNLGVAFNFSKATDGSSNIHLATVNNSERYVNLTSDKFFPITLRPHSDALNNKDVEFASGPGSQENFNVLITGPGALGEISPVNISSVLDPAVISGINQYFLPSISPLLGLKNPAAFNTTDCLTENSVKNLGSLSPLQVTAGEQFLVNHKYYELFTDLSYSARSLLINSVNAENKTPLVELFACEKFGLGVLITSKKFIAIENLTGILMALNGVFNSTKLPISLNLFSSPNVSYLAEAIRNNYAERTWVLSTILQLEIKPKSTQILAGTIAQFTSSCTDPITNAAIDCNVTWDFGDGYTAKGNSVVHKYVTNGHYLATATAEDTDGARQTQTANVDVVTLSQDNNAIGHWLVKHGDDEQPLNSIRSKTLIIEDTNILKIRLFAAYPQDNPQLGLSLKGFDFNTNTHGDGVYSLDDTSSGESCLGLYIDETAPESKLYCTSTKGRTSTHPFTGKVIVSPGVTVGSKKAIFEFNAYDTTCTTDIGTCDSIHVSGEVQFDLGF